MPTLSERRPLTAAIATPLFRLYRRILSPMLHAFGVSRCIYLPTCSEYAHIAILRHGWLKGTALAAARIARCNPMSRGGLDPVPD
jgi:putative membrane protein insertion efficiency factor